MTQAFCVPDTLPIITIMETKSTDLNQQKSPNAANGLILSSATTKLQKEWELLPLGRLGVTGNTLKLKLQASAAADKPM